MVKISGKNEQLRAVGRRKRAAARVRIEPGNGTIVVNGKPFDQYFSDFAAQEMIKAVLKSVGKEKDFNFSCKVQGGGKMGQATAVQHGIARALVKFNEDYKKSLNTTHFLTRDSRIKERKKFGHKKARRSPQWSKR
jgi:small subunit ribosomal protein S9